MDVALAASVAAGFVFDPLVTEHIVAAVLVLQAFLFPRWHAVARVLLAAAGTVLASLLQATPVWQIALQVPFHYGLAILAVVIAETVRSSHGTAVGALREAERFALYDTLTSLPNRQLFAADEVKIDHAFVSVMRTDRTAEAIVRATIELGRALGIRVVAEGVEDRATRLRLRDLGVHRLQGYAIARPMPPDALAAWTEPREAAIA